MTYRESTEKFSRMQLLKDNKDKEHNVKRRKSLSRAL